MLTKCKRNVKETNVKPVNSQDVDDAPAAGSEPLQPRLQPFREHSELRTLLHTVRGFSVPSSAVFITK